MKPFSFAIKKKDKTKVVTELFQQEFHNLKNKNCEILEKSVFYLTK